MQADKVELKTLVLLPQPLASRWTSVPSSRKARVCSHPPRSPSKSKMWWLYHLLPPLETWSFTKTIKWQHLTDKRTDQEETYFLFYTVTNLNVTYTISFFFFLFFQMNSRGPLNSEYFLETTVKFQHTKQLHTNQENVYQRPVAWVHEKSRCDTKPLSAPDASLSVTPHLYMFAPSVTWECSLIKEHP